jgi:TRAP-type C4-dicarboxylate transport system permease small subunit
MSRFTLIVNGIGAVGAAILVLLTCTDVMGRYLFNLPITGGFEATGLVLSVVATCGIVVSTASNSHISVDVIYERLSNRGKRILTYFSATLGIIFSAVLGWQGVVAVKNSITPYLDETPGLAHIVTFPFRIILAVGFMLCVFVLIYTLKHPTNSKTSENQEIL